MQSVKAQEELLIFPLKFWVKDRLIFHTASGNWLNT